jgi:hypothetical protein
MMISDSERLDAIETRLGAIADRLEAVVGGGRRLARRIDCVEGAVADAARVARDAASEASDLRDELDDHGD